MLLIISDINIPIFRGCVGILIPAESHKMTPVSERPKLKLLDNKKVFNKQRIITNDKVKEKNGTVTNF